LASTVVNPADSTAAEPNFDQSSWTGEQYENWQSTGQIPTSEPADSTPATPAAPTGETAADPAPASTEAHTPGKGAEARKAQLAREVQEALDRRKTVQSEWDQFEAWKKGKSGATAASPTATPASESKKPTRPVFGESGHDSETFEQYEQRLESHQEALAEFKAKEILAADREEREKQRKEAETKAERERIVQSFEERKQAAIAALKVTPEAFDEVAFTDKVPITATMDGFILDSDHGPRILYHLGQHPEQAVEIAAMTPYAQARALTKIELSFASEAAPTSGGKAPVAPITKAARPATDLKATSSAPVDALKAAIEADDYATYEAEANRRDVERRKRG